MLDIPVLPDGYEFHHIGYATKSIETERKLFEFMGYRREGEEFCDPAQGISGCFFTGPGPRIELLENLEGSDTLTPWINAGIKMYHFGYLVDDIHKAIDWTRSQRAKVIVQPVASVAFEARRICFTMFRNGLVLEFIEKAVSQEKLNLI